MMMPTENRRRIIVAAEEKAEDEIKRLGVVKPGVVKGNITEVKAGVEKAGNRTEPSIFCGDRPLYPAAGNLRHSDRQERGAGERDPADRTMAQMTARCRSHAVKPIAPAMTAGRQGGLAARPISRSACRAPSIAPAS